MTTIVVLLVLFINLFVCLSLIAFLYFFVIQPIQRRLESIGVQSQGYLQKQNTIPFPEKKPDGILPNMDEIPLEALYGESEIEANHSTLEQVEKGMSSNDPYSRIDLENDNAWKQLNELKANAEVHS